MGSESARKDDPAAETIRLHAFLPASRANGPGNRAVMWVQGCSLGCPGCFNPETHTLQGGEKVSVEALFERIRVLERQVEGLTISGGEPLQQRRPLLSLLRRVRSETGLSTLLFTGFSLEEAGRFPEFDELTSCLDVLLAGRYVEAQRVAQGLVGSANKRVVFFTERYGPADLLAIPEAEVWIEPDGTVTFSGIHPMQWQQEAGG